MKRKIKTRSKFEARVLADLDKRKVPYEYEAHTLKYTKPERICVYTPDIALLREDMSDNSRVVTYTTYLYIECKGNFTSQDRTKMLRVREHNKDVDIRLLFMRNNKLNKTSKIRYMDWATKHGFLCAIGKSIPEAWLKR